MWKFKATGRQRAAMQKLYPRFILHYKRVETTKPSSVILQVSSNTRVNTKLSAGSNSFQHDKLHSRASRRSRLWMIHPRTSIVNCRSQISCFQTDSIKIHYERNTKISGKGGTVGHPEKDLSITKNTLLMRRVEQIR